MLARILSPMTSLNVYRSCVRRLEREGVSTAELARLTKIHPSQLRRYKAGECSVGVDNARRLAPVLGVPVEHLLYGVPRKKKEPTQ